MEWTNDAILEFLDLYEKEPVIWDPSHKDHKNRNEVYDAWKRIESGYTHKVSINELKKKKDSLMATFRNCKSKLKNSTKSGAGTSDVYKPYWFAYSRMAGFLGNHETPKKTMNSESLQLQENEDEGEQIETLESQNLETADDLAGLLTATDETPPDRRCSPCGNTTGPKKRKVQGRNEAAIFEKMETAYDMLTKSKIQKPPAERSESAIYGELIAKRLEKMSPAERDYVMHEIDNVMYRAKFRFRQTSFFPNTQVIQQQPSPYSTSSYFNSPVTTPAPSPSPQEHNNMSTSATYQYVTSPSASVGFANNNSCEEGSNTTKQYYENFSM